jgi:hypothetical protein
MGYKEAEAEHEKLKGLVDSLSVISDVRGKLHDAEMALRGNKNNPEALEKLERNLRNVRVRILSEVTGIMKQFG